MQVRLLSYGMTLLGVIILSACKFVSIDSSHLSYVSDNIMMAVKHTGANCANGPAADPTHHLDGDNGELVLEQAKKLDKPPYGFSGDVVMGRISPAIVTKMEDIEAKCRRLLLVIDIKPDRNGRSFGMPIIEQDTTFKGWVPHFSEIYHRYDRRAISEFAAETRQKRFEQDFGKNNYGQAICRTWTSFCRFANIKGKHGMDRFFSYIEPDNKTKTIDAILGVRSEVGTYFSGRVTLKGIYRANPAAMVKFSDEELDKIKQDGI